MKAQRITKEELKKKLDDREAITILDVRNPMDFSASNAKIPGAVRIPLDELDKRMNELDPNKEVVAYCTWTEEHSSARAALMLIDKGFKKAGALLGGFNSWVNAGLPLEKKWSPVKPPRKKSFDAGQGSSLQKEDPDYYPLK